ncbi:MAG: FadR family transcriptional regulator [Deltaproteobacteria bacterium]|nr:FadR family transcriptional regulator [Deltaproteobacteria bacterium]
MYDMLKAVKKRRASEDVAQQIISLIKNGQLKKGEHLPAERELTDTFKVSRTTLREAIRSLESMGLVETRQGTGTYILAAGEDALIQCLTTGLYSEEDDLMDIFYLRKIIEPPIAQLAAGHANTSDILELEDIIKRQGEELASGKINPETGLLFHLTLARISKNRVLSRLLHALAELMNESRQNLSHDLRRAEKSLKGHQMILAAIKSEDCGEARTTMLDHLSGIEGVLFKKNRRSGKCTPTL